MSGFGITVLMFRIQLELDVREKSPDSPNWLAWADYLVLSAIVLSLLFVVLPIVAMSPPSNRIINVAAGSCGAAAVLLVAYPFAILDHYRIEIGAKREGGRQKGEPIERCIVVIAFLFAVSVFGGIIWFGSHAP